MIRNARILFVAAVLIAGCRDKRKPENNVPVVVATDTIVPAPPGSYNKDSLLLQTGQQILLAIKSKDYVGLVKHFHPDQQIRFSPYGYIDTSGDVRLSAEEFLALAGNNKMIHWGSYDGSGDPIDLSLKTYLDKFVYNADFLKAPKISLDQFVGAGNSLNNLRSVYPNSRFIEYHFAGFDKKYEGMDWSSLRLVFKEINNIFYLQAVVHDQWTI